jgi:UDP-glucose 4-epimerase
MTKPPRILVTGGTGFIGRNLVHLMAERGRKVELLVRRGIAVPEGVDAVHVVGDLAAGSVPAEPFRGADMIVHLAGHVMVRGAGSDEDSWNVRAARTMALRAREAGIPKVLVLRSIAATVVEREPHLARRYGLEKLAADQAIGATLGADQRVIFIRPPAVYGPGMSGALATLAELIRRGAPIPFGAARAPRNYISIGNLVRLLDQIAGAPDAAREKAHGRAFAVADGEPVATDSLVRMMAAAMGCRPRIVPVPLGLLRLAGRLTGRAEMISGAIDGLDLADNSPLTEIFGWTPHEAMPGSLAFLGEREDRLPDD